MKLRTVFHDEAFEFGEVADVAIATTPDGRIMARATAKAGGEHTFYYDTLWGLWNDWADLSGRNKNTLAEKLAEYAIKCGDDCSSNVVDGFAEQLLDGFIEGNGIDMDDAETEAMNADLIDFIEDMLVPEADQLIAEWNRDAQEAYEEREEARRGQY